MNDDTDSTAPTWASLMADENWPTAEEVEISSELDAAFRSVMLKHGIAARAAVDWAEDIALRQLQDLFYSCDWASGLPAEAIERARDMADLFAAVADDFAKQEHWMVHLFQAHPDEWPPDDCDLCRRSLLRRAPIVSLSDWRLPL